MGDDQGLRALTVARAEGTCFERHDCLLGFVLCRIPRQGGPPISANRLSHPRADSAARWGRVPVSKHSRSARDRYQLNSREITTTKTSAPATAMVAGAGSVGYVCIALLLVPDAGERSLRK